MTLEFLAITGGNVGIDIQDNTSSNSVTVSNCTIFGNNSYGIYLGTADSMPLITDNTIFGLPHNNTNTDNQAIGIINGNNDSGYAGSFTISGNIVHDCSQYGIDLDVYLTGLSVINNQVYACGTGIEVEDNTPGATNFATISGNSVFSNATGIAATGNVLLSQNLVFGQSGIGISTSNVVGILSNTVHDNAIGISTFNSTGPIEDNVVYHNSGDGIEAERSSPVIGNTVYGNGTGIALDNGSTAPVTNNLVYENTTQGILISNTGSPALTNNTVYQPTGDAIDIQTSSINVTLTNNILWAQAGYDLNVDATSEVGFQSDDNDLYVTGTGKLVFWQGQSILTLQSWFYLVGQDQHSLSMDPQFVQPTGPDGILGFSAANVGTPLRRSSMTAAPPAFQRTTGRSGRQSPGGGGQTST